MKKSSSKKKGDENGDENIKVINGSEENVINSNKNKALYFSSIVFSKYKKYMDNNPQNQSEKKINKTTTSPNKILIIDSIESEKIDEEGILSKINIYNSKANLNEVKKVHSQKYLFKSEIPSEEIFIRQKEQIKLMKEKNDKIKNNSLRTNTNIIKNNNHKRNYTIQNLGNLIEEFNSLNNNDNDNGNNKILRSQKFSTLNNNIKRKRSFRE